jgi:hypothetical protein
MFELIEVTTITLKITSVLMFGQNNMEVVINRASEPAKMHMVLTRSPKYLMDMMVRLIYSLANSMIASIKPELHKAVMDLTFQLMPQDLIMAAKNIR